MPFHGDAQAIRADDEQVDVAEIGLQCRAEAVSQPHPHPAPSTVSGGAVGNGRPVLRLVDAPVYETMDCGKSALGSE
eukprot:gene16093-biopygen11845